MDNKALKLAMLADDDRKDMENCIRDLMENSKVDRETAKSIAISLRNKYMPRVAQELGLSEAEALSLNDFSDNSINNFSPNDQTYFTNGTINEMGDYSPEGSDNVIVDDLGNEDETNAKSASQNNKNIREAMYEALSSPEFANFDNIEDDFVWEPYGTNEKQNVNERQAQSNQKRISNENLTKRGEKTTMTKRELQARKAQRANLIKIAEAETLNSSKKPFEYAGDAQYNVDREYPTMSLKDDSGNSLSGDTKDFSSAAGKFKVPTMNSSDDLLLRESEEPFRFGTGDGSLEYTIPREMLELKIPSEGVDLFDEFEVPTELSKMPRKTIVAMDDEEGEEEDFDILGGGDDEMGDDETFVGFDDDNEEGGMDEEMSPADVLAVIDSFDDESLDEFLAGFEEWANQNEIGIESEGEGGMAPEKHFEEEGDELAKTASVKAVLGDDFDLDLAEEVLYRDLIQAGVSDKDIAKLTYAQGIKLCHNIREAQGTNSVEVDLNLKKPLAKMEDDDDEDEICAGGNCMDNELAPESSVEEIQKLAEVREARMKVAYNIWTRMAVSNLIDVDEVDENVENWLNEGLTVKAMMQQGNIMLKTAASAARTKTASTTEDLAFTLATNPTMFGGSYAEKPAAHDLKIALKGLFTQPEVDI